MSRLPVRIPFQPPPLKSENTQTASDSPEPPPPITSRKVTHRQVLHAIQWCELICLAFNQYESMTDGPVTIRVDEDEVMNARLYLHQVLNIYHGGNGRVDTKEFTAELWNETVALAKEVQPSVKGLDETSWMERTRETMIDHMRSLYEPPSSSQESYSDMFRRILYGGYES